GLPYLARPVYGLRKPKASVRGTDVAGVVEAVGTAVTRFKPGDEVFGASTGSYAEYAAASEDELALKPSNLTFEQAATVPLAAIATTSFSTTSPITRCRACAARSPTAAS